MFQLSFDFWQDYIISPDKWWESQRFQLSFDFWPWSRLISLREFIEFQLSFDFWAHWRAVFASIPHRGFQLSFDFWDANRMWLVAQHYPKVSTIF